MISRDLGFNAKDLITATDAVYCTADNTAINAHNKAYNPCPRLAAENC